MIKFCWQSTLPPITAMLPILLLYETKCRKSLAVKVYKGVLWFYVIWDFREVEGKKLFLLVPVCHIEGSRTGGRDSESDVTTGSL